VSGGHCRPALDRHPLAARTRHRAHPPQTNHFPIATEHEVVGVLDVQTAGPLASSDRAMVATIVRIYGDVHELLDHSERDPIGDDVLLLSRLLRSSFRHFDRIHRLGGEEFVVVLDRVAADQASLAFERIRANVERFEFPQVGRVTVSVGLTLTDASDTPSSAFARADKALYHVKENGRNQVAPYETVVRGGQIVETQIVGEVELF
jgi:predicted signal transduction protein with EAL and GGDEF domain